MNKIFKTIKLFVFSLVLIMLMYTPVFAAGTALSIKLSNCPATLEKSGGSITCDTALSVINLQEGSQINSVSISADGFTIGTSASNATGTFTKTFETPISTNGDTSIGKLTYVISSDKLFGKQSLTVGGTYTFVGSSSAKPLETGNAHQFDYTDYSLTSISINSKKIENFAVDTKTYNLSVESDDPVVTIAANCKDSSKKVTIKFGDKEVADGKVTLVEGENTVTINNTKDTYTLKITYSKKNKASNNADLENIYVDGEAIKDFKKDTTQYSVTVQTFNAKGLVKGTPADSKATVDVKIMENGKPKDPEGVTLTIDKTFTFVITVTAEDGKTKKEYKVDILYKKLSSISKLKNDTTGLKVYALEKEDDKPKESSTIKPEFKPNILVYTVSVLSKIEYLKIECETEDKNATFVKGYGPRTVKLDYGFNKIEIKVQAEDGKKENQTTYVINVDREDDRTDIAEFDYLTINNQKIKFEDKRFEYDVKVKNIHEFLKFEYKLKGKNTKIFVNDKELTDKDRLSNVYSDSSFKFEEGKPVLLKIKLVSETGREAVYTFNITRLTEQESKAYISQIIVKNFALNFDKNKTEYTLKLDKETTELEFQINPEDEYITYEILGNKDLKNGSVITIKVKDSNGNHEYKITIEKEPDQVLIFGIEEHLFCYIVSGILVLLSAVILIKAKKLKNIESTI